CGVSITRGCLTSGASGSAGSCWYTSSPAPPTWPLSSAASRASSSTRPPRATLTNSAPGFMAANSAAPNSPVLAWSSMAQHTTASARRSTPCSPAVPVTSATSGGPPRSRLARTPSSRGPTGASRRAADRGQPACNGRPDRAEADHRDRRAEQRAPGRPVRPPPLQQRGPRLVKPPGEGKQVQDGELGHAVGIAAGIARDPRDPDAKLRRRGDVHAIEPDAELMDQAERARLDDAPADRGAER